MNTFLTNNIGEYLESHRLRYLPPAVQEHAGTILGVFAAQLEGREAARPAILEEIVKGPLNRPDLPSSVREAVPQVLGGYFEFLVETGRFPGAREWVEELDLVEKRYQARLRPDGSLRGETFTKRYTDVGRNDPCPCGSGRKFKKCCRDLLG